MLTAMTPRDILTAETMAFVRRALPRSPARVLEVGAGAGHVARALACEGHAVVAIDASARAVARARSAGHDVRHGDWHDFADPGPFDAILFTRSLHHIDRLDDAVDRCWPRLAAGGRVILEEFSAAEVDEPTAWWLRDQIATLRDDGAVEVEPASFLAGLLEAADPLAWWREHHGHLHRIEAIREAIERHGRIVDASDTPYLYRYIVGGVTTRDGALVDELRHAETTVIERGAIQAIGRHFVAEAG